MCETNSTATPDRVLLLIGFSLLMINLTNLSMRSLWVSSGGHVASKSATFGAVYSALHLHAMF